MSIFSQIRSILGKADGETAPAPETTAKAAITTTPVEPVERRSRKRLYSHKGRRVLIIDDSPTIVAALRKMLRSAGCFTIEASNAETGLELLRREKPELVFLDIVLPGMNGFAALRLIRRDPLAMHVPIIMISGNEQATEQFYVKRIGADDFMKKPFSRHEVFARIDTLIDANKLRLILALDEKQPAFPPIRPSAQPLPAFPAAGPAGKPGSSRPGIAAKAAVAPSETPPAAEPAAPLPAAAITAIAIAAEPAVRPSASADEIAAPPPAAADRVDRVADADSEPAPPPSSISAMQARKHLTEMGLQYFNQEQYIAAIERGDALAVELFVAGGCVNVCA